MIHTFEHYIVRTDIQTRTRSTIVVHVRTAQRETNEADDLS